ncbi:MAG TPA: hypothetical protein VEA60_15790 [Allosphingosinicella sp.]|nr:hypothetical protein [Allosphingosinicella sp.]
MPLTLISALLLAPLVESISSDPVISPPPPVSGRLGVGDDVRQNLYQLHLDVGSARERGEISAAAARDLNSQVERIRRQIARMGNVVGYRQRARLRTRIDALRSQLAESRAEG